MSMTSGTEQYSDEFYQGIATGSARSAQIVVPLLASMYHPASVVDVGCGTGAWLHEFELLGIEDLVGIDGGRDVGAHRAYRCGDLVIGDLTAPLQLSRQFDLALCLEVAEHLPEGSSLALVEELCALSDRVVFSAAIPGQGGTGHINEQWPSYWTAVFASQGYVVSDTIRGKIWTDRDVEVWYRQNLLVYERGASPQRTDAAAAGSLDIVHPQLFLRAGSHTSDPTMRELLSRLPSAARRSAAFHLGRFRNRTRGS